jgi:acid phosphatase class B
MSESPLPRTRVNTAAAQAQLRTAATAWQLFYAQEDAYADDAEELGAYGFRQVRARGRTKTPATCVAGVGGDVL